MSKKPNQNKAEKGINLDDLLGIKLVKCLVLKGSTGRIAGSETRVPLLECRILEGDFEGFVTKYGLVTQSVTEKVLASGYKEEDENGNELKYVFLPEPQDKNDAMIWVNFIG